MTEDMEKRKRAEDEAKRKIRDQELAIILAMSEEEREDIIKRCLCKENENRERGEVGLGDVGVLAFEINCPDNFELTGGFGEHGLASLRVQHKILMREGIEANKGIYERIVQGIVHNLPELQSRIIRMIADPENNHFVDSGILGEKEEYVRNLRKAWEFFKEKYPDIIMLDLKGNPFEEYLRQESSSNES